MVLRWFSPSENLLLPGIRAELLTDCSQLARWPAAAVPDVEYLHDIRLDGEKDSVDVWLSAVQELPNFDRRVSALGRYRAACGQRGQRGNRLSQSAKPALTGVSRLLREEPIVNGGDIGLSSVG